MKRPENKDKVLHWSAIFFTQFFKIFWLHSIGMKTWGITMVSFEKLKRSSNEKMTQGVARKHTGMTQNLMKWVCRSARVDG